VELVTGVTVTPLVDGEVVSVLVPVDNGDVSVEVEALPDADGDVSVELVLAPDKGLVLVALAAVDFAFAPITEPAEFANEEIIAVFTASEFPPFNNEVEAALATEPTVFPIWASVASVRP
jgi:hypothetical protein